MEIYFLLKYFKFIMNLLFNVPHIKYLNYNHNHKNQFLCQFKCCKKDKMILKIKYYNYKNIFTLVINIHKHDLYGLII